MVQVLIFFLLFLAHVGFGYCQQVEKIPLETSGTSDSYYLTVDPRSGEVKGVQVLLPGFGQSAESIFPETKLHEESFENDILLVSPGLG